MYGLWGMGLMSLAKVIVVVDEGIDVQNTAEAWWYALGNIDPERDVRFTRGPVDDLDHSSQLPAFGSKMGIDGTRKWPEEGFTRPWPDLIEMSGDVKAKVDVLWKRLGIAPLEG
jgi:4-hydroxy-3-polyprenylbenzoate decarboxylase